MKKRISLMAHDIRSPLAVIKGYLQYREGFDLMAEEKEYWQAATTCVERLAAIADDMSDLVKEELSQKILEKPSPPLNETLKTESEQRVLVVDDDHEIQVQWKNLLSKNNMNYIGVERGEDLLQMKMDYSKLSLAIVDYEFENSSLNGFDVIEFLKRKQVKSIHLCTGLYDNPEIRILAKKHGVDSIIAKPIPLDSCLRF